jgi:hypothetical protein
VSLRLGDTKGVVLSALRSQYDLSEIYGPVPDSINAPDDWLVQDKGHKTPTDKVLGSLRFRLGKLTSITRGWTPEDRDYSGMAIVAYRPGRPNSSQDQDASNSERLVLPVDGGRYRST